MGRQTRPRVMPSDQLRENSMISINDADPTAQSQRRYRSPLESRGRPNAQRLAGDVEVWVVIETQESGLMAHDPTRVATPPATSRHPNHSLPLLPSGPGGVCKLSSREDRRSRHKTTLERRRTAQATAESGGERGIRTLDTGISRIHTFQACSFNHSDISPARSGDPIRGARKRGAEDTRKARRRQAAGGGRGAICRYPVPLRTSGPAAPKAAATGRFDTTDEHGGVPEDGKDDGRSRPFRRAQSAPPGLPRCAARQVSGNALAGALDRTVPAKPTDSPGTRRSRDRLSCGPGRDRPGRPFLGPPASILLRGTAKKRPGSPRDEGWERV